MSESGGSEPKFSRGDIRNARRYFWEFGLAMVAYATVLIVMLMVVEEGGSAAFWFLLPVVPMVVASLAVISHMRRLDEYGKIVQLTGMAVGFLVAMLTSIVFGFLAIGGVQWWGSSWVTFSLGMLAWLVAAAVQWARDQRPEAA